MIQQEEAEPYFKNQIRVFHVVLVIVGVYTLWSLLVHTEPIWFRELIAWYHDPHNPDNLWHSLWDDLIEAFWV